MRRRKLVVALREARVLGTALVVATLCAVQLAIAAAHSELVPDGDPAVLLTVTGRGVQVYECRDTEPGPRWVLTGPIADLVDAQGNVVGDHGAGPYWALRDGSRITATVAARVDAPVPGAVPWLLLRATSVGGPGALSPVTHVQRLHTTGGAAPITGCAGATTGATVEVPYTAEYVFLGGGEATTRGEALSRR